MTPLLSATASAALAAAMLAGVWLVGDGGISQAPGSRAVGRPHIASHADARFALCDGPARRTCVVDGDTFWLDRQKIRIADIDAPEISSPRCPAEKRRGEIARDRLVELLHGGTFGLVAGERDHDRYGRLLRIVVRDGRSLGGMLVEEGLARRWGEPHRDWCALTLQ